MNPSAAPAESCTDRAAKTSAVTAQGSTVFQRMYLKLLATTKTAVVEPHRPERATACA